MKKYSIFLVLVLLNISLVLSVCTLNLDKEIYNSQATVTATMLCDDKNEDNDVYMLNWTNSSGYVLESDTGTAPKHDIAFFDTYVLPANYNDTYGDYINATLTGGDLEGEDFANVTGDNAFSLIINHTHFSPTTFVGELFSLNYEVRDVNGKLVSNAKCFTFGTDQYESPLAVCGDSVSLNGRGVCSDVLDYIFDEGESYIVRTRCNCGTGINACFDDDGNEVNLSTGSTTTPFTTDTWLTVNTVTDKSIYSLKDEIFVCANVTNVKKSERLQLHILSQVRCSAGLDNNNDRDRVLINYNSFEDVDERGIDNGTTQMQCVKFIIPEEFYLMGRNSECYASTNVFVLNNKHESLISYASTSPIFNITSDELNLEPDWQYINDLTINSIINSSKFTNVNGSGTGNIDLRLYFNGEVDIRNMLELINKISNITIKNTTSNLIEHTDYELEFLEDGYVELEIRDKDLSDYWFNVTIDFYDLNLRQTEALEGIENKTGTFHLEVDCPTFAKIDEAMTCTIKAQVEDSQLVEKEVDFTCYISLDGIRYSQLNFNKMITRTISEIDKEFLIPSIISDDTELVLQCYADYYNLGSRRDSFYDTFTAVEDPVYGTKGYTGKVDVIDKLETNESQDITTGDIEEKKDTTSKLLICIIITFILLFLIAIIIIKLSSKNKNQ